MIDSQLERWLKYFEEMGFIHIEWCTMINPEDRNTLLSFGPTNKMRDKWMEMFFDGFDG